MGVLAYCEQQPRAPESSHQKAKNAGRDAGATVSMGKITQNLEYPKSNFL
jgi:hypothetical protein